VVFNEELTSVGFTVVNAFMGKSTGVFFGDEGFTVKEAAFRIPLSPPVVKSFPRGPLFIVGAVVFGTFIGDLFAVASNDSFFTFAGASFINFDLSATAFFKLFNNENFTEDDEVFDTFTGMCSTFWECILIPSNTRRKQISAPSRTNDMTVMEKG